LRGWYNRVIERATRSGPLTRTLLRVDRTPAQVVVGLARSGVFRLRGVLVGTIAYQTYAAMLGVRLRGALTQTSDVDVAVLLQILLQKRPEDLKRVWEEAVQRGPVWRELIQGGTAQLPAPLQTSLKASGLSTRNAADSKREF
jgi:hypothetical protein